MTDINGTLDARQLKTLEVTFYGFHDFTMQAISTLCASVDGGYSFHLARSNGKPPLGKKQEYEGETVNGVTHEYVDQTSNGGFTGDEFAGTVTFILGDFHLVVSYAT